MRRRSRPPDREGRGYTEFTNYANFTIAAALSIVLGVITWAALALARSLAGGTVSAAA